MNYYIMPGLKRQYMDFRRIYKPDIIVNEVCHHYKFDKVDFMFRKTARKYSYARYICFIIMIKNTTLNKSDIGRYFNLDHTSVIYGLKKIKSMMDCNDPYIDDYISIESNLKSQFSEIAA